MSSCNLTPPHLPPICSDERNYIDMSDSIMRTTNERDSSVTAEETRSHGSLPRGGRESRRISSVPWNAPRNPNLRPRHMLRRPRRYGIDLD